LGFLSYKDFITSPRYAIVKEDLLSQAGNIFQDRASGIFGA